MSEGLQQVALETGSPRRFRRAHRGYGRNKPWIVPAILETRALKRRSTALEMINVLREI